jgi:hypothetical protein
VQANDGTVNGNSTASSTLTVGNTLPVVSNVNITPTTAVYDTDLTCNYDFDDDDGNGDNSTIVWKVNGSIVNGSGDQLTSNNAFVGGDTVSCTVTPKDGMGGVGTPETGSLTISNTPPVVSGVDVTPNAPKTDQALSCAYTYSDMDGNSNNSSYAWTVSSTQGGAGSAVGGNSSTLASANFSRDEWVTCTVTANDGITNGNSDSDQVQILNSAPVVSVAAVSPSDPVAGTAWVNCDYSFSDVDGDADSSEVKWYKNNNHVHTGVSYTGPYVGGDNLYCLVTANDGTNNGNTSTSTVITVGNTKPTITMSPITPTNATVLSTLTCNVSTYDVDGDPVSVNYEWLVESAIVQSGTNNQLSGQFGYGQFVYCLATPNDGVIYGYGALEYIQIQNAAPSITAVTITPNPTPATVLSSYVSTVNNYSDPDGHPSDLQYQWKRNGSNLSGQTSSTLAMGLTVRGDDVSLVVTPCDSFGACGTTKTSNTLDVLNASPTAPSVSISPSVAEPDDDLTCTISSNADDPDGDPLTYQYVWVLQGGTNSGNYQILPSSETTLGDVWQCLARAIDDQGDAYSYGPWSSVATRIIEDITAPPAPTLVIPDPYINDDWLTIQGTNCEIGTTCTVLCLDDSFNIYNMPETCLNDGNGNGIFSANASGIPRGDDLNCAASCQDDYDNVSGTSNQITTQVCILEDYYEDSSGTGDSSTFPVDYGTALADETNDNVFFLGTILKEAGTWDSDWYVIDGADIPYEGYFNDYNFRIDVYGSNMTLYTAKVYKGGTSGSNVECASMTQGYTEYNDCVRDTYTGSYPYHDGYGTNYCSDYPTSTYNQCEDMSNFYYIQVIRDTTQAESCDYYSVVVSNGYTQEGTDTCENSAPPAP